MSDSVTLRLVIGGLIAAILGSLASTTWLLHDGTDAAGVALVSGFGMTALGSLGALLVSGRTRADPTVAQAVEQAHGRGAADMLVMLGDGSPQKPQEVVVTNDEGSPVPTVEAPATKPRARLRKPAAD